MNDDDALRALLGVGDARIARQPLAGRTSFAVELVTCTHAAGEERFVLKRFESTQLPRADWHAQARREIGVYREVLDADRLGTARCTGHLDAPQDGRCWLLLEHVDAAALRHDDFALWQQAARWLALLQSHATTIGARRDVLQVHDAAFYRATAAAAVIAVAARSQADGDRLAGVVATLDAVIESWMAPAPTLVHGSFLPQNLLVDASREPLRICPVDWEHAALGSPFLDLASLAGHRGRSKTAPLCAAYLDAAREYGLPAPELDQVVAAVRSLWLFRHLRSLTRSAQWQYSADQIRGLVVLVEEERRALAG